MKKCYFKKKAIMQQIVILYSSNCPSIEKLSNEIMKGISSVNGIKTYAISCTKAQEQLDEINSADAIIFGSPTYFGSLSSDMKAFFDTTVDIWKNKKWHNKVAAGFTHSHSPSGDKLMTLMAMMIFAMQNGMIWTGLDLLPGESYNLPVEWQDLGHDVITVNTLGAWMGLMSHSNVAQGIQISKNDLLTARHFGKRIALITKQMKS